jgi:hypothetical protein
VTEISALRDIRLTAFGFVTDQKTRTAVRGGPAVPVAVVSSKKC